MVVVSHHNSVYFSRADLLPRPFGILVRFGVPSRDKKRIPFEVSSILVLALVVGFGTVGPFAGFVVG